MPSTRHLHPGVAARQPKDAPAAVQLVVTLIAASGAQAALRACVAQLAVEADWLAPEACDIAGITEQAVRSAIAERPIDVIVQPKAGRRKKLLVADLESTIIENEMLDELADFIGRRAQVADITRRAMNGELDFAGALAERVALLRGLPARVLDEAAARIRLTPGARRLVATMRAAGAVTALVSGGFAVFAEPIAARLGFERVVANRLDIAGDRLAGTVAAPLVTAATKREALVALARERGIGLAETLAIGDGANDLPMLKTAGIGIAFRAKPTVAAAASHRIDHADLTALLYAQGFRAAEIAGD